MDLHHSSRRWASVDQLSSDLYEQQSFDSTLQRRNHAHLDRSPVAISGSGLNKSISIPLGTLL